MILNTCNMRLISINYIYMYICAYTCPKHVSWKIWLSLTHPRKSYPSVALSALCKRRIQNVWFRLVVDGYCSVIYCFIAYGQCPWCPSTHNIYYKCVLRCILHITIWWPKSTWPLKNKNRFRVWGTDRIADVIWGAQEGDKELTTLSRVNCTFPLFNKVML